MFVRKVATRPSNFATSSTNSLAHNRLGLLTRGPFQTPDRRDDEHERAVIPINHSSSGCSWSFSNLALFPPNRSSELQDPSLRSAPPRSFLIQRNPSTGELHDAWEPPADGLDMQIMRRHDEDVSTAATPQRPRLKCAACDAEGSDNSTDERRLRVSNGVDDPDLEEEESPSSVDGPDESQLVDTRTVEQNPSPATPAQALSDGGAPSPRCPTGTTVDSTVDLTSAGLSAGYLTAYGIMARMKVLPDATTWDGVSVVESMVSGRSTCPATLTQPGPCRGSSTFVVGAASGRSNVQPVQPAARNTFYDFHTTHTRALSVLHDAGRNPSGVNSCQVVCDQTYSCAGTAVGHHTITRSFTKGTFNSQNVTMVSVTKT